MKELKIERIERIENEQSLDNLNVNPFYTLPTQEGFTWTLTSRLGHILHLAEERFGARDSSYTLLGIEFAADGPRIWYPGNRRHIAIQLSPAALNDEFVACYQLAHEVVHLLSPTGTSYTTVLEEGLATYYAQCYLQECLGYSAETVDTLANDAQPYKAACSMAVALLDIDDQAIKKLRAVEPCLSRIDTELIMRHYPALGADMGRHLAERFDRPYTAL